MGTEKREILLATQAALKTVHVQTNRGRIKKDDFPEWLVKYLHYKRGNHISKFSFQGYEPYLPIARQLNQFEEVRVLKGGRVAGPPPISTAPSCLSHDPPLPFLFMSRHPCFREELVAICFIKSLRSH